MFLEPRGAEVPRFRKLPVQDVRDLYLRNWEETTEWMYQDGDGTELFFVGPGDQKGGQRLRPGCERGTDRSFRAR